MIDLNNLKNLNIQIYLDGADLDIVKKENNNSLIKGYTSNPSLMHQSGIKSYENFIKDFLKITKKPVSFEVTDDELDNIEIQARKISSFGKNIYVKIPVTNTKGNSTIPIIKKLTKDNIKLNITAIFTTHQLQEIINNINSNTEIILSIFAGRIADTGVNPENLFIETKKFIINKKKENFKLLWASVREVYNIYQADKVGCDIITVTQDILKKVVLKNKNLKEYSIETVKMFYNDAKKGNLSI